MWIFMALAFMTGLTMHTGHKFAFLYIFIMPYLLQCLFQAAYPKDPILCRMTYDVFI
jgi:hypothetical protein